MIPVVNPAGVAELLEFGLLGLALSRYSGCWVGLKCVHDTVNTAASIEIDPARPTFRMPEDFAVPPGPQHPLAGPPLAQEERLHRFKLGAVRAFARTNSFRPADIRQPACAPRHRVDRQVLSGPASGAADLGIDRAMAARLGARLLKLGLVWPLEPERMRAFAAGLEQIVVVEEKRALIETQLKDLLYGGAGAPQIVGKRDERDAALFPSHGALSSNQVALPRRADPEVDPDAPRRQARRAPPAPRCRAGATNPILRTPYFCSGCPHNTSTRVPEGSIARVGIGCHSWRRGGPRQHASPRWAARA